MEEEEEIQNAHESLNVGAFRVAILDSEGSSPRPDNKETNLVEKWCSHKTRKQVCDWEDNMQAAKYRSNGSRQTPFSF